MKTSSAYRFMTIVNKELIEFARSYKLIWVPLVFIVFGIMQPISTHYMPFILEHAGNLPVGSVIELPTPAAAEVLAGTLSQYSVLAVIIIALMAMGTISQERSSGIASIILAKPISIVTYISTKWLAYVVLVCGSFWVGIAVTAYYTQLLFGSFDLLLLVRSVLVYSLWLIFIVTLTIVCSSIWRSSGATAVITIAVIAGLALLTSLPIKYLHYTPQQLQSIATQMIAGSSIDYWQLSLIVIITIVLIITLISLATVRLTKSAALDE